MGDIGGSRRTTDRRCRGARGIYAGRETMRACILHPGSTETHLATLVAEAAASATQSLS